MIALITGGAANGKSYFAENLARTLPGPSIYLNTMRPYSADSAQEAARHAPPADFVRIDCYTALSELRLPLRGVIVLECLCNLLDNELFSARTPDPVASILRGIDALAEQCSDLLLVTNEIGCGCQEYTESTLHYLDTLGRLNRAAAARADVVLEIVAGIPVVHKGTFPVQLPPGDRGLTLILGGAASGRYACAKALGFSDADLDQRRVILRPETGCGIIPATPALRAHRGEDGRTNILLARQAGTVIRMVCGIPIYLKK